MQKNTRLYHTEQSDKLEQQYIDAPDDAKITRSYAETLLQLGKLAEAKEVLSPLLAEETLSPQSVYLLARIEYLTGKYAEAETLYRTLLDQFPEYQEKAENGLEHVYYQTNQYQKAQALPHTAQTETGIGALMRAFGEREPYQVQWTGEKETTIPFLVTDPLPVVQVEVNGEPQIFFIDTGASETFINESLAKSLGIEAIATQVQEYAGGVSVETSYGVLDSMTLNSVTLESVPVNISNLDHFTSLFGDIEISGVFGTGIFRQFQTTVNYLDGELVLKARGEQSRNLQNDPNAIEVPFLLADTHFMLCKAIINGSEVNIFPDSGLVSDASLLLPIGTLEYTGIPIPEPKKPSEEGSGGGLGGADFSVGYFTANSFALKGLPEVADMAGMFGVFPENHYFDENIGIFADGIISHNYLKDYSWTIDFDRMTMFFSE